MFSMIAPRRRGMRCDARGMAPEIERLNLNVDAKLDPAETTGDPQLARQLGPLRPTR
jgi:hypothetical protein